EFGYYAMPILHDGRLVGRVDPKLHRDRGLLEIKSLHLEDGFDGGQRFDVELRESIEDLAGFVGADDVRINQA
ncbi:MAG: DNA glycosylase AlkZ-like family protein, partial [Gemmatimonadota bacterium]